MRFSTMPKFMDMKFLTMAILALPVMVAANSQNKITDWNAQLAAKHLNDIENPSTWDTTMFKRDMDFFRHVEMPITSGAYPTPSYDLLPGTYSGIGISSQFMEIDNGRHLVFPSLAVNKNSLNEKRIPDKKNECFCIIGVATDIEIDTINYTYARGVMSSRNNPDYIGEGYVKIRDGQIDYVAFITADGDEYAIVNMRLFNLKNGRTILIVPQEDGSLRSMQIKQPSILSLADVDSYMKSLYENKDIRRFINTTNDGFGKPE